MDCPESKLSQPLQLVDQASLQAAITVCFVRMMTARTGSQHDKGFRPVEQLLSWPQMPVPSMPFYLLIAFCKSPLRYMRHPTKANLDQGDSLDRARLRQCNSLHLRPVAHRHAAESL